MATAPALSDYAMIGDCRTAAMISRSGSINWLCLPDFSSPSVFAQLLDNEKGGYFSVTLEDVTAISRRYVPDTAVLETTLTGPEGSIRITDCMPVLPGSRHHTKLFSLREILRRVDVLSGNPVITMRLEARPNYAVGKYKFRARGKLGWALNYGRHLLNLITDFPLAQDSSGLHGALQAKENGRFWFSLTFEEGMPGVLLPLGEDAEARLQATIGWWQEWCGKCRYQGEWRDPVIRSAITLRMLTFTQSGALLAAVTTSLPERSQGWMNWDYRYCWPRDSAVALSAFMHIGLREEAHAFFDWLMVAAATTRPRLSNMYDIYGRSNITERLLPWFSGYNGAKPVRIGNAVSEQVQHDVYGEVMMAIENLVDYFGAPSPAERTLIEGLGKAIARVWREPDNGIWEIRDERRHYTYSKVMAWYVFDSLIRLHEKGFVDGPVVLYREERASLRDLIEREGFNPSRNCYTAFFGGDTVDASLLLLPRCGYVAHDDPRMQGTWEAIQNDLEHNGLILRYPPGFANSQPGEGAFIICNFWAVNYLNGCGRRDEAHARLAHLITLANDVGLYNEGIDTETLAALGNMPQAFSHAGLITAITRMAGADKKIKEAA